MRKNDVACPFSNEDISTSGYIFSPVLGFRKSTPLLLNRRKLNICVSEFAMVSKEPWPMRTPPSQLSSMKRIAELWSVTVWSTKFRLAHGEITSKGNLGP
jgi:hypothetical protein